MADQLDFTESYEKKLPGSLNVLTILTFIMSAYELYSGVSNFLSGKAKLEELDKNMDKIKEAPAWAQQFASPEVREMMQQGYDNRIPMLIIGLIATSLCIFGAIEMRKLKKQGYFLWLTGELLPFISAAIFAPAFYSTFAVYFGIFPLIFIILYTVHRKYLVY